MKTQGCSLPDCFRTAETDLCHMHQAEADQAMREWELDKVLAEEDVVERLYGHPRSAETYEETL